MIDLIVSNFREHATAIPRVCAGMQVQEGPALVSTDGGGSSDTFNIVFVENASALTQLELAERQAYYAKQKAAFCLWLPEEERSPEVLDLLRAEGLQQQDMAVGMGFSLHDYQLSDERYDNIERVQTAEQMEAYAAVIAANWSPPDQDVLRYYRQATPHYLAAGANSYLFVYRHEQEVVATIELFATDKRTAGIYGLSTKSAFRRRGIGSALMVHVMDFAAKNGFENLILHASEDGLGIYQRLGFQSYTGLYEFT